MTAQDTTTRHNGLMVSSPGDVGLQRRAPLAAADGELLVEPDLVGLCGTDLEIIDGLIDSAYIRYPLALGHEWTGLVAGDSPLAGRRVVVEGIIGCGHCARCSAGETNLCETYDEIGFTRDGAATGEIVVPARLAHRLDPAVSAEDAVLTEPSAVACRGLTRAGVTPGCRALVIGDGTIALLAVALLRLWSPAEIVVLGRRPGQAALAAAAGATRFVTEPAGLGGFDLVVEAAGVAEATASALVAARRGGTVLLLGLPPHGETVALAPDDVVNNDLAILGSFGYTSRAWRDVVTLLNSGQFRPGFLVTHRFALADWEQAIATLRGAQSSRGKILLEVR
ncbi:MAG TPA: alcohol dehydrogenase catalytic domain-containing protein [Streptosporangiaceae bacterium]|nr:alcohol dehydrogenase catalytic domain-containing protein [Streptosporangiaceae bacterium]